MSHIRCRLASQSRQNIKNGKRSKSSDHHQCKHERRNHWRSSFGCRNGAALFGHAPLGDPWAVRFREVTVIIGATQHGSGQTIDNIISIHFQELAVSSQKAPGVSHAAKGGIVTLLQLSQSRHGNPRLVRHVRQRKLSFLADGFEFFAERLIH